MTSDVVSEGKKGRRDTLIPSPPFFFVFGFLYCNIHEYHTHNTTQHNQYLQIKINVCMYVQYAVSRRKIVYYEYRAAHAYD